MTPRDGETPERGLSPRVQARNEIFGHLAKAGVSGADAMRMFSALEEAVRRELPAPTPALASDTPTGGGGMSARNAVFALLTPYLRHDASCLTNRGEDSGPCTCGLQDARHQAHMALLATPVAPAPAVSGDAAKLRVWVEDAMADCINAESPEKEKAAVDALVEKIRRALASAPVAEGRLTTSC